MAPVISARIGGFCVDGLFGARNYELTLNEDSPVTIISGPNGVGKTHILKIVRGILALDHASIASEPFESATLMFRSPRKSLTVTRRNEDDEDVILYEAHSSYSSSVDEYRLTPNDYAGEDDEPFPPWIMSLPDGRFFDKRTERILSRNFLERRYRSAFNASRGQVLEKSPWLKRLLLSPPILIDTQRLGDLSMESALPGNAELRHGVKGAGRRVSQYISQVKIEINDAQRASLNASQKADRTFASRVLEKARTTIKEQELRERYQRIADQHQELYKSGLADESIDVTFPDSKPNPTERRILNVFLDDWERRLQPLLPVNQKLKALRQIINGKLIGKQMVVDRSGSLRFETTPDKKPLQVGQLSSGEQHLLALFTVLLFSAQPGAVVLIDEPEISMHAAWKHAFLDDIVEVANIAGLQIIVATHSTSIINGQWNLVHEIGI
jgi:ABC-type transport system involved in cytochrome c biogenesis ATPase subunit